MLLEFVAALAAALCAAGLAMMGRRLSGNRLPRFMIPVAAGAGMIGFAIWSEYSWYGRTADALPEGFAVARSVEERSWFRPWTYAVPFVSRFAAVDVGRAKTNPGLPGQVMVDVYLFARHLPTARVPLVIDCVAGREARLGEGVSFADDGGLVGAEWVPMDPDDPVRSIVCGET